MQVVDVDPGFFPLSYPAPNKRTVRSLFAANEAYLSALATRRILVQRIARKDLSPTRYVLDFSSGIWIESDRPITGRLGGRGGENSGPTDVEDAGWLLLCNKIFSRTADDGPINRKENRGLPRVLPSVTPDAPGPISV
jgi:hypothetical protein